MTELLNLIDSFLCHPVTSWFMVGDVVAFTLFWIAFFLLVEIPRVVRIAKGMTHA